MHCTLQNVDGGLIQINGAQDYYYLCVYTQGADVGYKHVSSKGKVPRIALNVQVCAETIVYVSQSYLLLSVLSLFWYSKVLLKIFGLPYNKKQDHIKDFHVMTYFRNYFLKYKPLLKPVKYTWISLL